MSQRGRQPDRERAGETDRHETTQGQHNVRSSVSEAGCAGSLSNSLYV